MERIEKVFPEVTAAFEYLLHMQETLEVELF